MTAVRQRTVRAKKTGGLVCTLVASTVGCTSVPTARAPTLPGPAHDRRQSPSSPKGPLVWRSASSAGVVEVIDKGAFRAIRLDGVIVGAARRTRPGTLRLLPRLARVLRVMRPAAKRVLVVGLGTGRLPQRLGASNFQVTTVARSQALVDAARKYFAFNGHALVAADLRALGKPDQRYDIVVVDLKTRPDVKAFVEHELEQVRSATLLGPAGVVVLKVNISPEDPKLLHLVRKLGERYTHTFATGVGRERQLMYVVHSAEALNVAEAGKVFGALWLWTPQHHRPEGPDQEQRLSRQRRVRIVGYLSEDPTSRILLLDLPRVERGAVRYLLQGPRAQALRRRLRKSLASRRKPATEELAGRAVGTVGKLPRARYISALVGTAQVRSIVHWDSTQALESRRTVGDIRLPFGGVLYDFQLESIEGLISTDQWESLRDSALAPITRAAVVAVRRGDLAAAAAQLTRYLQTFADRVAAVLARRLQGYDEMRRLQAALQAEADAPRAKGLDQTLALAQACDRARSGAGYAYTRSNRQAQRLVEALAQCAESHYERVAARGRKRQRVWAASRLCELLEERLEDGKGSAAKSKSTTAIKRRLQALRATFGRQLREVGVPARPLQSVAD